jgi:periplasmic divalent cation tolerance protein
MEPVLLVLSNLPDRERALELARALVDGGLAACVNVLSGCTSIYRWRGAVETADEVPVLIKTRQSLYPRVEQAIQRLHPYEVPEVIAVPLAAGLPAYLEWVCAETEPTDAK